MCPHKQVDSSWLFIGLSRGMAIAVCIIITCIAGCADDDESDSTERDYRQEMRQFVQDIRAYARGINPRFIVVPQNGHELLTKNGEEDGPPMLDYLNAIDGVGREDLFYGYAEDDVATPVAERDSMMAFMDLAKSHGIQPLVTDYCSTRSHVDDSYRQNTARGYLSFAADHRELDDIPAYPASPFNVHSGDVTSLADARNFLYLLDPGAYATKEAFLSALRSTDYDVLILDLFHDTQPLSQDEVAALRVKSNGGLRLVIAYMSIGEAENYRYYWQKKWEVEPPTWLARENPDWPGNYKVRYWDPDWQHLIYGEDDSYLQRILNAGFDGVYLDIIDAYEYFEEE